jgi:hypothetical protein
MAKERTPQYFYVGNSAPTKIKSAVKPTKKVKGGNDTDLYNPIFNMDKNFGINFSKTRPIDIAQSQPYVNIEILKLGGEVVSNLNVAFFQKQIDFSAINGPGRYTDRPLISLKSVEISSEQSAGFFYFTNVVLNLKIHKKDELSDRAILGLLFPGCPLRMTYGWNSKDEWLNKSKQALVLNVVSYDITLDETGQADLTVKCMAYNNVMENTLIGDLNTIEKSNPNVSAQEQNGLFSNYKQTSEFLEYIDGLEKNQTKNQNDYSVITSSAKAYKNVEQKTRGKISENFTKYLSNLSSAKLRQHASFGKKTQVDVVSFFDVVYTLCNDTLKSMSALVPVEKFEVIFGNFNDHCLDYSGKSIADFPIDYTKFMNWIKDKAHEGQRTVLIKDLLDSLCSIFIENETYMRGSSKTEGNVFQKPEMSVNFVNSGDTLTLFIVDGKANVPPTTNQIKDLKKASLAEAQQKISNGTDIPIITLGNSNSFVKGVTFSRIDDAYMETVLIERAYDNSQFTARSGVPNSQLQNTQAAKTPLSLPLQGSAKVVGHVGWKRLSCFYLSTGIFLIDAIYTITKVTHTLSSENFETQIEFIWH